ncbi:MAG: hypothetical protein KatS3mg015_3140 [Fimbriimonadales bacterium]|nr:MAG: hypothetical protein KatS3mg015_3140 [Fimbriimonadales bacterium]
MDKEAARRLLDKVLGHRSMRARFASWSGTCSRTSTRGTTPAFAGAYIYDSFRNQVRQFKRIAKYTDPEGEDDRRAGRSSCSGGTQLERARTMQRNFVAEYLKRKEREAALVAFYTDDRNDWRLSFVRLEYRTEEGEDGRVRVTPELTPARRYSFLVGEGEPSHTARQQLFGLLTSEDRPTLDDLEHAFEIERVTKAFFDEYKDLFLTIKEDLDDVRVRRPEVEEEFQRCGLTSEGFAKKLLGQIVFLYFVQKKGWLGVPKDASWGEGPKDFLRRLFEKRYGVYTNFFDDRLEPLFYEALATERGAGSYYHPFDCRIPFLNGGLFEPPGGYAWDRVPLHLPDETFKKVLDTFDRYNFTVREDEPLEKEVAVDPEMLGKVFENLLEVKDRKAKGAFYTPREIVAYMCNESLIAYLDEALNNAEEAGAPAVPRADLEALVRQGERWAENDRRVQAAGRETDTYRWAAPEAVRTHADAIDRALADIAVCDPAIGSGAFPVGMMQAVVRVREALSPYLSEDPGRTAYAFKRHAIEHCLYGVDIEPSAVDIAQLRLWLSLVVDEDDFQTIQPLPNLRYKIVEGDALGGVTLSLENNAAYDRLQQLIPEHVRAYSPREKERLQHEIDALIRQITGGVFDFNVYFGDVLHRKGGFDVVIGNPPYVRHEEITDLKPALKKNFSSTFKSTADLYVYFLERGVKLARHRGHLCYITSNSYLNASFADRLRVFLKQQTKLKQLIDFGETPVFEAVTEPAVLLLQRAQPPRDHQVALLKWEKKKSLAELRALNGEAFIQIPQRDLDDDRWLVETREVLELIGKLVKIGQPLGDVVVDFYRGVVTGCNEAFIIDASTRERLIAEDPKSTEIIKPFLRGSDISRYSRPSITQYIIFTRRGININDYPAIKRFLERFRHRLEPKPKGWKPSKPGEKWKGRKSGNYKWYEIQDSIAYYQEFETPKIIYQDIARYYGMTWDESGAYLANTCYFIPRAKKWMLGILLSSTMRFYVYTVLGSDEGGFIRLFSYHVKHFPLPHVENPETIEHLVDKMLQLHAGTAAEVKARQAEIDRLDCEIDRLVYRLYGLTDDEIALVEGRVQGSA